ncbi:MAG: phospho-sugar mutase, partial [Ezakiella sp.]
MKRKWTDESIYDKKTIERVLSMSDEEYVEAFSGNLEFGTAGLRGYMDSGTNRMNIYTVKKAAIAIAKWILKNDAREKGIAIGYDVRHNSRDFAKITASVMKYFNIKYYFFDEIVATPHLSYAVRHLETFCGVMVTASHNPKDYNGYKVYKKTGSQILEDDAEVIEKFMNEITEK